METKETLRITYRVREDETGEVRHLTPAEAEARPCPAPSYTAYEQKLIREQLDREQLDPEFHKRSRIYPPLRAWAKSTETHSTDQNYLCEERMSGLETNNKILPASQTGVLWHHIGLHGDERRLYFNHNGNDNAELSYQALLRWERPPIINIGTTREDVHAVTELSRKYIEKLRHTNQRVGFEPVFWSTQLQDAWDTYLYMVLKEPAEIAHVKFQKPKPIDGDEDTEAILEATEEEKNEREEQYNDATVSWNGDEPTDPGFDRAVDHIKDEGLRETEQGVPSWIDFFAWCREVLNPEGYFKLTDSQKKILEEHPELKESVIRLSGWTKDREEEIKNHPEFPRVVALYKMLFMNIDIQDIDSTRDPNTVSQWLGRKPHRPGDSIPASEWNKAIGHYICTIVLNGRAQLKILAPLTAPVADAEAALRKEWDKAKSKARYNATQDAKTDRLSKTATKAWIEKSVGRIDAAYEGVLIMKHSGFVINELDEKITADVTIPPIYEGEE